MNTPTYLRTRRTQSESIRQRGREQELSEMEQSIIELLAERPNQTKVEIIYQLGGSPLAEKSFDNLAKRNILVSTKLGGNVQTEIAKYHKGDVLWEVNESIEDMAN